MAASFHLPGMIRIAIAAMQNGGKGMESIAVTAKRQQSSCLRISPENAYPLIFSNTSGLVT